jgi:MFS family permease
MSEIGTEEQAQHLSGIIEEATKKDADHYAALQLPEFRYLLLSGAFSALAGRCLAVVIGFQVYKLTHSPLSLAYLGIIEAIPAVSLALFGGHIADRHDRRRILLLTQSVSVVCALLFALISFNLHRSGLIALYVVVFVAGIARGFADPAATAFEAQVVPQSLFVNASSWSSSVWQMCAIGGPALGGFAYELLGESRTYLMIASLLAISWFATSRITPKPLPPAQGEESIRESIAIGVRYVFQNQVIVGSMALDLFAVLFGGAIALLPIFATDILRVGPKGLGFLSAAPSVGALLIMLWSTRHPPIKHAGRNLLWCVAGFGVCMIAFAFSTNLYVSLLALAFSGAFDGVSVVIRKTILRLMSPEHLRGRIAAINYIFIGSSNEIGAFESGVAAQLLGTTRSVWMGGIVTLITVGITALVAPKLVRLRISTNEGNEKTVPAP